MKRYLLYTCVSRAKQVFVLVGTKEAVAIAVSNDKIQQRNTLLAKRLAGISSVARDTCKPYSKSNLVVCGRFIRCYPANPDKIVVDPRGVEPLASRVRF